MNMDGSKTSEGELDISAKENINRLCSGGFNLFHVVVIGDYMLDRYVFGEANRISPEAPVPVLEFSEEKLAPGGAGNVLANLTGLGLSVTAIGRIGNDRYADDLLGLQAMSVADSSYMIRSGRTIVKTRIMGSRRHQMLRIDQEEMIVPNDNEIKIALNSLKKCIDKKINGVVISDYGKGFCSPDLCRSVICLCRNHGVPVFVDPKNKDWSHYSDAFLITPNMRELRIVAGVDVKNEDEDVVKNGTVLVNKYNFKNLLVTRSEKGATLINKLGFLHERATTKAEVYDVSGAGDTMIAVVAAFVIAGIPLKEAISVANIASQIVIGKIGTYAINAASLLYRIQRENFFDQHLIGHCSGKESVRKVVNWHEANVMCNKLRNEGKKIIFTNGCFDILHSGHVDLLTIARQKGDCLIVAVNSDDSVRRLKGTKRPVNSCADRIKILSAFEAVNFIVIFEEDTPEKLLSQLRPDIIVKGGDYNKEDVVGRDHADEVVIVPLTKGFSTTGIINKIGRKNDE
ncbi:MAG: bifunctional heptose 7-phosphate kinase/heptose 1-phosphate adenyltransferase [Synergistaceae bacterium]|nr:bifunctional heptose 7-phosphate kinase/heptose 1-phosphate adenyltransferase [Synergistaceae bacterium]